MKVVISIGGSLLSNPFTGDNIKKYIDIIHIIKPLCTKLVIVVGGGTIARDYIEVAKKLNLSAFLGC